MSKAAKIKLLGSLIKNRKTPVVSEVITNIKTIKNSKKEMGKIEGPAKKLLLQTLVSKIANPKALDEKGSHLEKSIIAFGAPYREKWLKENKDRIESKQDYDTLLRWDAKTLLVGESPKNLGGPITDNNPLFNIRSLDEMNISIETEPFYEKPAAKSMLGTYMAWVFNSNKEVSGDIFKYSPQILLDAVKMKADMIKPKKATGPKKEDLAKLKQEIYDEAMRLGFGVMGVTKVDRRFLGGGDDSVAPYDNLIVLGMEMDKDEVEEFPNAGKNTKESAIQKIYQNSGTNTHKLADFIRSKGWNCHARVALDGGIKVVPHAVNAGIANFATSGITITKEFGGRLRYSAITLEAPLEIDRSKDFNVEEFCSRCRMCQKVCPTQAIPKEAIRHRGAMKRKVSDHKCYSSMIGLRHGCMYCIKACPIQKLGYEKAMDSLPDYYQYNTL